MKYKININGFTEDCQAETLDAALATARDWVGQTEWGSQHQPVWAVIHILDEAEEESLASETICIPQDVPPCIDEDPHCWRQTGVVGNGGGVIITSTCDTCGCEMTQDTGASDPFGGPSVLTTYERRI